MAAPAASVPTPAPSLGSDAATGATATVASPLADAVADVPPDAVATADGVALAEAVEGRAVADGVDPGFDPAVVPGVDPAVVLGALEGLGAAVVFFVVEVALGLVVGAGWLVALGAGGATRGCWPDPKRNPTTVPGAGLWLATPLEL